MTVSGPPKSRMMRLRGVGCVSLYWYMPCVEALMNLPDAIWRSAFTCSAADRDTGTIYLEA